MKAKINLVIEVENPNHIVEMIKDIESYCKIKSQDSISINNTSILSWRIGDIPFNMEENN